MGKTTTIATCLSIAITFGCSGRTAETLRGSGGASAVNSSNSGGADTGGRGAAGNTTSTCAPGLERCECYGNLTCNVGLECRSSLCVASASGGTVGTTTATNGGAGSWASGGTGTSGNIGGVGATTSNSTQTAGFGNTLGGASASGGTSATGATSSIESGGAGAGKGGSSNGPPASGGGTAAGASGTGDPFQICPGLPLPVQPNDAGACGAPSVELVPPKFDLMFAIDRTLSMTYCLDGRRDTCGLVSAEPSRWMILQQGLELFFANTQISPLEHQPRLGVRFFGNTGNPSDPLECLAQTYATPQIGLQDFATASASITSAMNTMRDNLGGQTPWQPPLQGVLQYAQQWQIAHPERTTAVVFITDGFPTECATDMADIEQTVAEFSRGVTGDYNTVGAPAIRTHIIGISGDFTGGTRYNIDQVAAAGATTEATLVGTKQEVAATLANILDSTPTCNLRLPTAFIGKTNVRLAYSPFDGEPQEIPEVIARHRCDQEHGGWFYDTADSTEQITLCPCTCANVGAGRISVMQGCDF